MFQIISNVNILVVFNRECSDVVFINENADAHQLEENFPPKKTCFTSTEDAMDVGTTSYVSDNEIDAEAELESMFFDFIHYPFRLIFEMQKLFVCLDYLFIGTFSKEGYIMQL